MCVRACAYVRVRMCVCVCVCVWLYVCVPLFSFSCQYSLWNHLRITRQSIPALPHHMPNLPKVINSSFHICRWRWLWRWHFMISFPASVGRWRCCCRNSCLLNYFLGQVCHDYKVCIWGVCHNSITPCESVQCMLFFWALPPYITSKNVQKTIFSFQHSSILTLPSLRNVQGTFSQGAVEFWLNP